MRKIFLYCATMFVAYSSVAQNYNVTINSQFKPMSVEEHLLYMQAQAQRQAYEEEMRARSKRLLNSTKTMLIKL